METKLLLSGQTSFLEPTPVDADVIPFSMNSAGRLRVAAKQATFVPMAAALSSLASALTLDVAEASNVVVHVKNTGTANMVAGAFVFEGSVDSTNGVDGTWFGLQSARSNSNTIENATGTLSLASGVGSAYAWELSVNAVHWFRIRCTTATTASSVANWTVLRGSYATEPIPALQPSTVTSTPSPGTPFFITTTASTNATLVKNIGVSLLELTVFNSTTATVYVRLYNKATAPVVGTDVPLMVVPVTASNLSSLSFGAIGKRFALGLAMAVTAAAGNTDATVVAASALVSGTYL